MIRRAHFALAVLLLGMNLHSQQPASVQEQPPVQRPVPSAANEIQPTDLSHDYEMREWLVKGAKAADHLSGLGVERTLAEEWTESAETGSRVYPDFKSLRGSPRRRAAVLFLPCTPSMQTAYLYLLAPDDHAWKVSDKLELDSSQQLKFARNRGNPEQHFERSPDRSTKNLSLGPKGSPLHTICIHARISRPSKLTLSQAN